MHRPLHLQALKRCSGYLPSQGGLACSFGQIVRRPPGWSGGRKRDGGARRLARSDVLVRASADRRPDAGYLSRAGIHRRRWASRLQPECFPTSSGAQQGTFTPRSVSLSNSQGLKNRQQRRLSEVNHAKQRPRPRPPGAEVGSAAFWLGTRPHRLPGSLASQSAATVAVVRSRRRSPKRRRRRSPSCCGCR